MLPPTTRTASSSPTVTWLRNLLVAGRETRAGAIRPAPRAAGANEASAAGPGHASPVSVRCPEAVTARRAGRHRHGQGDPQPPAQDHSPDGTGPAATFRTEQCAQQDGEEGEGGSPGEQAHAHRQRHHRHRRPVATPACDTVEHGQDRQEAERGGDEMGPSRGRPPRHGGGGPTDQPTSPAMTGVHQVAPARRSMTTATRARTATNAAISITTAGHRATGVVLATTQSTRRSPGSNSPNTLRPR